MSASRDHDGTDREVADERPETVDAGTEAAGGESEAADAKPDAAGDGPGLSRRRLLGGAALVGGVGALTGVGTAAFVVDRELFAGGLFAVGELDLTVAWADGSSDGAVRLAIDDVAPGRSGVEMLTASVDDNPAWLWLRSTTCPDPGYDLSDALDVTLRHADCGGLLGPVVETAGGDALSGSLADVLALLRDGVALDADPASASRNCLAPGEPACLALEWSLPAGLSPDLQAAVVHDEVAVELAFAATQCRHDDGAVSPWSPVEPCAAGDDCPSCVVLGKYELPDDRPQRLGVGDRLPVATDDAPTGYELLVTGVENKAAGTPDEETTGVAFDLVVAGTTDPGPAVCEVVVKGGPGANTYSIDPPASGSGGVLDAPDGKAISHVTVAVCAAAP